MPISWLLVVLFGLTWLPAAAAASSWVAPTARSVSDSNEPTFQSVGAGIIPRDVVAAIAQDQAGFLWVASGDGLLRFDGHRFRPQERDSADPRARNLGWILAMATTADGRLWIGTEADGLVVYDPATDRLTDQRWPAAGNGPLPTVSALAVDPDGGLWVGTLESGLLHVNPAKAGQQPVPGLPDERMGKRISALLVDRSANLWVGTAQGLGLRRTGTDRFDVLPLGPTTAGMQRSVQALLQATDGAVWVGTADGALFRLPPGTDQAIRLTPDTPGGGTDAVTSLLQAPDGKVWVGRTTGIDWHDGQTGELLRQIRPDPRRHQGLAGAHVTGLLLDRAGSIWVAGFGLGLQRHEPGGAIGLRGVDLDTGSPFSTADTRALLQLRSGDVWASVHTTGVVAMNAQLQSKGLVGPAGRDITAMVQAADESVWLGGPGQLLRVSTDGMALGSYTHGGGATNHLTQGPDGSLWISTDDGLYRLRPGAAAATLVPQANGQPLRGALWMTAVGPDAALWVAGKNGLHRVAPGADALQLVEARPDAALGTPVVLALLFDSQGRLWLDTPVSGLHRMKAWDGRLAQFEQISARHEIYGRPFGVNLLEDAAGRIWSHMHVYDPRADTLHELTAADGVSFGTGWFRSYAKTQNGRLLFGGSKGILVVQADRFQARPFVPPVVVTELRINGQPKPAQMRLQDVSLQPGQRSLNVEFAALDFLQPDQHRYAYKLTGFDQEWTQTGAGARMAAYNSLDPGQYTLQVRTANREGVWSPHELSLPVHVLPAWWQRSEFKAALVLLWVLAILAIVQLRTRMLRSQRALLQTAVRARTVELEAARKGLEQRVQMRTRELSLATEAAEAANRAKTSFLLNMSHEMRTPLNAILGLTHLRRQQARDDEERGHLGKVENAAQHLLGAINDVLDYSNMEAGTAELADAPFVMTEIFDSLKDRLATNAQAKKLVLLFDLDPRLQTLPPLLGDKQRITGILMNFASNALKFTEHGVVRISAMLLDEQASDVSLRFHVEDTGPGIASQTQARLFNAFEQAEGPLVRKHGGAGLGLVLCKRWAEMMSGTVGLSSAPGKGSDFWFAVQLRKAAVPGESPSKLVAESTAEPELADRGHRVLLVEDDPVNQIVAAAMLQSLGLLVDVAEDGAAAVRMANAVHYSLIFMDLQMPNMDGLQATRTIRSAGADPQVPIVGLTAFTAAADRQRCLEAGMNDHLGKPVVPAHLAAATQRWLRRSAVAAAQPGAQAQP